MLLLGKINFLQKMEINGYTNIMIMVRRLVQASPLLGSVLPPWVLLDDALIK